MVEFRKPVDFPTGTVANLVFRLRGGAGAQFDNATLLVAGSVLGQDIDRPRARELGIEVGIFRPGPANAITDVEGVMVGQVTVTEGDRVNTGVTAILPHPGSLYQHYTVCYLGTKKAAATVSSNSTINTRQRVPA